MKLRVVCVVMIVVGCGSEPTKPVAPVAPVAPAATMGAGLLPLLWADGAGAEVLRQR